MSLQRYDLIAPNGFYIIGNGVCRLTALHPLQGAFTHVMCVMKCNRKCKVWAESAFCILGRINPALRTCEHANMFACSRRIPPSPLEAGFKPPHYRLQRKKDNRGLRLRGTLYFLVSKVARKPRRCRGCFVPFFRKKVPKNPRQMPAPTSSRLTFETGAYSRVCKQTGPVSCHF